MADTQNIQPRDLIESLTLEGLNRTSDEYFKKQSSSIAIMGKPFTTQALAPHTLSGLSTICKGLEFRPTMRVVDFGAGTCWLSRYLAQMGCDPIALDVSPAALELGKQLFDEYPICSERPGSPSFLVYDGRKINLPDNSVDRIICFDAFHHVPNPEEVLAEFYRILKPSGLIGFREPSLGHSQTEESQREMREFNVLENDVDKNDIFKVWKSFGPGEFRVIYQPDLHLEFDYEAFQRLYSDDAEANRVAQHLLDVNRISNNFFLSKGPFLYDSRMIEGLDARIQLINPSSKVNAFDWVSIDVELTNRGKNRWLTTSNRDDYGVVALGCHLLSSDGDVMKHDIARFPLPHDLDPQESVKVSAHFQLPTGAGSYKLKFDVVSELVCWFSQHVDCAVTLDIEVQ